MVLGKPWKRRVKPGLSVPLCSSPLNRKDCLSYTASVKLCYLLLQIKCISFEVAVGFDKVNAVDKVDGKADI